MTDAAEHGRSGHAMVSAAPTPTGAKDFASTHRVKKLLDSYMGSAARSLTGPSHSSLELDSPSAYRHLQQQQTAAYKLPADIELSKTCVGGDGDDDAEENFKGGRRTSSCSTMDDGGGLKQNGQVTLSR